MKMTLEQRMRRAMKTEARKTGGRIEPREAARIAVNQTCRFYDRTINQLRPSERDDGHDTGKRVMDEINAPVRHS